MPDTDITALLHSLHSAGKDSNSGRAVREWGCENHPYGPGIGPDSHPGLQMVTYRTRDTQLF